MFKPPDRPLRILLVKPDITSVSLGFATLARVPPLDLLMVAASAQGHECRIIDMRLEPEDQLEAELRSWKPDLVGVTAYSAEAEEAKKHCRQAKAVFPEVPVVWGGYHATMATDDVMAEPSVDFVVFGEGERTFPELLEALTGGTTCRDVLGLVWRDGDEVVYNPPRPQISDLDTLPYVDWGLVERYQDRYFLNVMGQVGTVETTRGCPYACSFCSVWVFNSGRYRKKSLSRVMSEMDRLPESLDVVAFIDDEFWMDHRRALALADAIIERPDTWKGKRWHYWAQVRTDDVRRCPELTRRWSKAGMRVLALGIESHKEEELGHLYEKGNTVSNAEFAISQVHEAGIETWGCFIVNPDWEERDFAGLIEFVLRCEIAFPQFTILTPLPGTKLTERMKEAGQIDPQFYDFRLLDFFHLATRPRLSLRGFYEQLAELYARTSMGANPKVYRRAVKNGVISREWLRSPMCRQLTGFLKRLTDPEAYLQVHRMLGGR